jgi:hypothetical protein
MVLNGRDGNIGVERERKRSQLVKGYGIREREVWG